VRTRLLVVAAAVVAVAVGGALVIRWVDDGDAPVTGVHRVEPGACPAVSSDEPDHYSLPEPLPGEPDSIAPGAVRVWMCQGPGTPLDVPRDPLTTGADDIARIVNDLPMLRDDEEIGCAGDGGPGYRLRFHYADGSVVDAVGQMYGCGMVQVGTTLHVGDREWTPAREFVRLLREQRDAISAPTPPDQPTCTAADETTVFGPVSPVGRADEMVTAVLCAWNGRGISGPPDLTAPVPADELAALIADHAGNRSDAHPTGRECRSGRQLSIQGLTAWGDRVAMDGFCSVFRDVTTRPQEESLDYWRPGPEARAILERLLGTSPVSATACPSGPDVPLDADEPQAEPGTVPAGATSVRLCLGPGNPFHEPVDALVTEVDRLAEVIHDLEPRTVTACTDDLGLGYRLVFTYPDGTAIAATGQLYGCGTVTVGGRELVGAAAPWNLFVAALRDQRAATPAPGAGFGPTCRGPRGGQRQLVSPVALPTEMTTAVLCVLKPDNPERARRIRVPAEDLALLLEDQATSSDGRRPTDAGCLGDRRSFALRGVTAWGDRVLMEGYCGLVAVPGLTTDDEVTYWHPGPEAQAVIDRLYAAAEPLR